MSRIAIPAIEAATGATADVYAQAKKIPGGSVPNLFAAVGQLAPASLAAALNTEDGLASNSLGKQELKTLELLVGSRPAATTVAAHHMLSKMMGLTARALHAIRAVPTTGDAKRGALVHVDFPAVQ